MSTPSSPTCSRRADPHPSPRRAHRAPFTAPREPRTPGGGDVVVDREGKVPRHWGGARGQPSVADGDGDGPGVGRAVSAGLGVGDGDGLVRA